MNIKRIMGAGLLLLSTAGVVSAEEVGSVDTVFKLLGPDHKIVVEAFDDPDVSNVTCYISRAKTGGRHVGCGHFLPAGWADYAV